MFFFFVEHLGREEQNHGVAGGQGLDRNSPSAPQNPTPIHEFGRVITSSFFLVILHACGCQFLWTTVPKNT